MTSASPGPLGKGPGDDVRPRGLHAFSVFVAVWTFALLFVGGLVTGREAGMAFPDWPLSYGSVNPPLWWATDGQREEHGHRLLGAGLGLLVLGLAIALQRREPRVGVRRLGWALGLLVALQGGLGGFRVLADLPVAAFVHGVLGQGVFCVTVALALLTSPGWRDAPPPAAVEGARRLHRRALLAVAAVFLQVVLGAVLRHSRAGHSMAHVLPHATWALVTIVLGLAAAGEALGRHGDRPALQRPALLLGGGLVLQAVLGTFAFFANVGGVAAAERPPSQFWTTTVHQAAGALVLAAAVVLHLRARRILREGDPVPAEAAERSESAVAARSVA